MTEPDPDRSTTSVLGPTVAGTWYPSAPDALDRQLDEMMRDAAPIDSPAPQAELRGIIAPHAGFVYSGAVAARGFRQLQGRAPGRVILIGPSHYADFRGMRTAPASAYRTPAGEVPLDGDGIATLTRDPLVVADRVPFEREHCLEAEIPFLQRVLAPGWRLLPLLIGASTPAESRSRLARLLAPLLDPETVLVVSSDFTHYGAAFGYLPFRTRVPAKIRELDLGAIDRIVARDRTGFDRYVRETGATICGRAAIDVLLDLLPPGTAARLLEYETSGRLTGDWTHSVSYASIGFWWSA